MKKTDKENVVIYVRVSSHDQRGDLDRQVARPTEWATRKNMVLSEVVAEVGSGMNGRRKKLARLLSDKSATSYCCRASGSSGQIRRGAPRSGTFSSGSPR